MNERLLPPREVYKRLGVHYMTVKRWIYSGRIRAVKTPTGRWLIPESEVARMLGGGAGAGGTRAVIYAREILEPEGRPREAGGAPEAVLRREGGSLGTIYARHPFMPSPTPARSASPPR